MEIRNKQESANLIKKLKLNVLPQQMFHSPKDSDVTEFLEKYPADYYAVRDRDIVNSPKYNLKVKKEDVVNYVKEKELKNFLVNVSSYNYKDNLLCTCDMQINSFDFSVYLWVSLNKETSGRENKEDIYLNTDIYDKRLKKIPGISIAIDYIFKNNLFNMVVESSVFNVNLGINNEPISIWELRTHY